MGLEGVLSELRLPSSESEAIAASNSAAVVSAQAVVRFEPDETLVSKFMISKYFVMNMMKSNKLKQEITD